MKLPRFHRILSIAKVQLTGRDLEILRQVARHRFLDSRQIALLVDGSTQQVLRRLQRLYHHGYLDRPRAQVKYFSEDGSRPLVYALANEGARAITELGVTKPRLDNRNVKQLYMRHTLLVSDVMVAFARGSLSTNAPRLLTEPELAPGKSPSKAFSWAVVIKANAKSRRVGIFPDRVFALKSSAACNQVLYFLEADAGTMPIRRRSLEQSSIWRKLLAYEATWSQEVHHSRFNTKRFRVLFVTELEERMNNLIDECAKLPRGRGLFLFTTFKALRESPNAFEHLWHTASGKMETAWKEASLLTHDMMMPIATHNESPVLFQPERSSLCQTVLPQIQLQELDQS